MTDQIRELPTPTPPEAETRADGAVGLGAGVISRELPPRRPPAPETSGRGAVGMGAGVISAGFPV